MRRSFFFAVVFHIDLLAYLGFVFPNSDRLPSGIAFLNELLSSMLFYVETWIDLEMRS